MKIVVVFSLVLAAFLSLASFGSVPVLAGGGGSLEHAAAQEDGRAPKKVKKEKRTKELRNIFGKLALGLVLGALGMALLAILFLFTNILLPAAIFLWLSMLLGAPAWLASMILGAIGIKEDEKNGMAIAALIVVGMIFIAIIVLLLVAFL